MGPRHDIRECWKSDASWHNLDKEHVLHTTQIPGEDNKKGAPGKVTGWARGAVGMSHSFCRRDSYRASADANTQPHFMLRE